MTHLTPRQKRLIDRLARRLPTATLDEAADYLATIAQDRRHAQSTYDAYRRAQLAGLDQAAAYYLGAHGHRWADVDEWGPDRFDISSITREEAYA